MRDELERTMRMNYLYDFYHELLTDKQRNYIKLYYLEDYALSEIAETLDVTRQAVYDNLKRSRDSLEHYEENLGMYEAFEARTEIIEQLKSKVHDEEVLKLIEQLEKLD
ncbi:putative DNA-binding protein [Aliicoccus persicus]|uniref:UPF0122 protein K8V35_05140 n=1 Tax=Aliicoccus persicus TaxID=930138 RepID=A0A662Z0D2_9STAP|nr:putative DNA-binding protein [Aliicoccus persicus]SEV81463.1 hypothetical protein SAMN05192557_0162 [Aliicoccus persicus]HJE19718.1 putative DNA-binding protein [Aliicoccus persicus]